MNKINFCKPIIGLCAYSGTGKTTLLEKLIPIFTSQNVNVAVIKHAHHTFDIDHPNKDSYKVRKAGAQQILISSKERWALIHENTSSIEELSLEQALQQINTENIDLIIVEGFKEANIAKIEVHRPSLNKPLLSSNDQNIIAIATDEAEKIDLNLPLLDLNNAKEIATFIRQFMDK